MKGENYVRRNFKYVSPDSEDGKRFIEEGIGNYLFYEKENCRIKLLVHLDKEDEKVFYCKYVWGKNEGYTFKYETIERKGKKELISCNEYDKSQSFLQNVLSLIDGCWVEIRRFIPFKEQREFLKVETETMEKNNSIIY